MPWLAMRSRLYSITLLQSSAGIVVLQRGRDLVHDAGALRGEEAFGGERLDALDHHAAHHLDRGRGADLIGPAIDAAHVQFVDQQRHHGLRRAGRRAAAASGGARDGSARGPRRRHSAPRRRAAAAVSCLRPGETELMSRIVRIAGQMRRDRSRRLEARSRRHRRHDDVGAAHRIGGRSREPRADRLAGLLSLRAVVLGKQDVPRGDLLDAGLAQARGDRLAGFAEADETDARLVASCRLQLALDPLIEALDVDDDARVRPVADALLARRSASTRNSTVASVDLGDLRARAQAACRPASPHMPDVEMRAEALVARRQQVLDRVEGRGFHQVDHHRRRQHAHAAGADARRGVLLADLSAALPVRPGFKPKGQACALAATGGVPWVWNDSIVFSPQAWPFLRSSSVQVIGFQSGARISRAPALATSTRLPPGS